MPMIDTYAATGTFPDTHKLAVDAAAIVREVEQVPDILMFRQNTTAFVHEMPPGTFAVWPCLGGLPAIWSATLSCGADKPRISGTAARAAHKREQISTRPPRGHNNSLKTMHCSWIGGDYQV
jgi:hypothetical protein